MTSDRLNLGVYEALRSFDGFFALLPEHQKRLSRSCKELGIEAPDLGKLLEEHAVGNQRFRVDVTTSGVELQVQELPEWNGQFLYPESWSVKTVTLARENPELKTRNTAPQKKEREQAQEEGFDEVLLCSEDGQVLEGSITNFWMIKDAALHTPKSGMLPGIGRSLLLKAAAACEIPVQEREILKAELDQAEAIFLSNSIRGMIRVIRVGERELPSDLHPLIEQLNGWCRRFLLDRIHETSRQRAELEGRQTRLMGILNLTPDSFSDGGRFDQEDLIEVARQMIADGAEVLDIGGESTGPGSVDVPLSEELQRVLPAIEALRAEFPDVKLSIDTWKSEVAQAAVDRGVDIINDITAGRGDPRIAKVAAEAGVPLILMYSKDDGPRTTKRAVDYEDVTAHVKAFLKERLEWVRSQGVKEVYLDPGMGGFISVIPDYSFELIDRLEAFYDLGCPLVVGASRKSFLGDDREGGTLATTLKMRGRVDLLRVHSVLENQTVSS